VISRLGTIIRLELVAIARLRWMRLFTVAFALLTIGVAYSSGALHDMGAADGFGRVTVALLPLVLALVPLIGLLIGVIGQAVDDDGAGFLFAQPVSRAEVMLGRWAGESIALSGAIALGLASGGTAILASAGPADATRFLVLTAAALVLGIVYVSIGTLLAAIAPRRAAALGAACFVWFVSVLLYDAIVLAGASWLTSRAGARVLFLSVFANATDLIRVMTLSTAGTSHILGAAGESWLAFLGGQGRATALAMLALAAWIAFPLMLGRAFLARRDL
jgi:Cu-processing system permease protein